MADNWAGGVVPTSSGTSTVLVFAPDAVYSATNSLSGTFGVKELTATAGTVTLSGNKLLFGGATGVYKVTNDSGNLLTINNAVDLSVGGALSATSSLTFSGAGGIRLNGAVAALGTGDPIVSAFYSADTSVTYAGGFNYTASSFRSPAFYGSGSVTLQGPSAITNLALQGPIVTFGQGSTSFTGALRGLNIGFGSAVAVESSGTVSVAAGTPFYIAYGNSSGLDGAAVGSGSTGVLTVRSGGVVTASGTTFIDIGDKQQNSARAHHGTLNLDGGVFETARTFITNRLGTPGNFSALSSGTIMFNGGTLRALGDNAAWINNSLTTVAVKDGGAVIDSGSFAVTIGKHLSRHNTSSGGLTKLGAGTLTLTGSNTYVGATTVSAGTLALASGASIDASTVISIATGAALNVANVVGYSVTSGQTLAGHGVVVGPVTIRGTLAPGSSPGVLTFQDALTLDSMSSTVLEINGVTRGMSYDGIDLMGDALTYGGVLTLAIGSVFDPGSYSFNLFDGFSDAPSGDFGSILLTGAATGSFTSTGAGVWEATEGANTWLFSQSTGDLTLVVAVPEPTTSLLLAMGAGVMLLRGRRRKRWQFSDKRPDQPAAATA